MRPTAAHPKPIARPERARWSFGPVLGTVCAVMLTVITSQVGRASGLGWWAPATVTLAAALLVTAVWAYKQIDLRGRDLYAGEQVTPVRALPYRLVCVALGGAWAAWCATFGYDPRLWLLLFLGALLLATLSPMFAPRTPPQVDPATLAAYLPAATPAQVVDPLLRQWEQLLNAVLLVRDGKPGVGISRIAHWDRKTGYSVHGLLPPGSRHTYRSIGEESLGIASSLRLPVGCPVKVEQGEHQGAFVVKVSTVNDLSKVIEYPAELVRRSAVADFPIGIYRDGSQAMIDFHQSSAIAVGMRGSGKTIVMQVMTATAVQCVDAIVWHVDLNGGSIAAPWVRPWALGQCDRPPVDWVATTAEEAIRVATVGLAIAKDRKSRYQGKLLNEDTDVLPLSPETPAILIMVDEGAEMFGEDASPEAVRAATMLRELQRIGRAMCVNVIFSVMRGTRDCVPAGAKKLTNVKIVMRVDGDDEIAYVLDWAKGLRADDLTEPGAGFLRRGVAPPEMFKGFRLKGSDMGRIAIGASPWRPQLDRGGQLVGGSIYAGRWDRPETVAFVDRLAGREPDVEVAPSVAVDAAEVEAMVKGTVSPLAMAAAFESLADGFQTHLAEQLDSPASSFDAATSGEVDTVDAMTDQQADDEQDQAADQSGYDLVCQWVRDAGPEGIKREQLVALATDARVTRRPSTVSNWLKRATEEGLVGSKGAHEWGTWVWVGHDDDGQAAAEVQAASTSG